MYLKSILKLSTITVVSLILCSQSIYASNPSIDHPPFDADILSLTYDENKNLVQLKVKNTGVNTDTGKFHLQVFAIANNDQYSVYQVPLNLEINEEKNISFLFYPKVFLDSTIIVAELYPTTTSDQYMIHLFDSKQLSFKLNSFDTIDHEVIETEEGYQITIESFEGLMGISHEEINEYCSSFTVVSESNDFSIDLLQSETILNLDKNNKLQFFCEPVLDSKSVIPLAYAQSTDVKTYLEQILKFFSYPSEDLSKSYMNNLCYSHDQCIDLTIKRELIQEQEESYDYVVMLLLDHIFVVVIVLITSIVFPVYLKYASKPTYGGDYEYVKN